MTLVISRTVQRLWRSSVFVTWGAMATRLLAMVVALPLVLSVYTPEEASLWFLLALIFGLVSVAEFGFSTTYTRLLSYAVGGASVHQLINSDLLAKVTQSHPNVDTLRRVCSLMRLTGLVLSAMGGVLFFVIGNFAAYRFIRELPEPTIGWIATEISLLAATAFLWGQVYVSFIQGMNRILDLRRWELFANFGQLLSITIVLYFRGNLLTLIAVTHAWSLFTVLRNAWLCKKLDHLRVFSAHSPVLDRDVWAAAWPPMWRTGVAAFFALGVVQFSGLFYAQIGTAKEVTAYLFQLRLIGLVRQFSLPPFYNKIPLLIQSMAGSQFERLRQVAQSGMNISYWSFAFSFFVGGVASKYFIDLITEKNIVFDPDLWSMFGIAFFLERQAGMHSQLYMMTNKIVTHYLHSITGLIYIAAALLLFSNYGALAFPLGYTIALALCFLPASTYLSYKTYSLVFPKFELKTSLIPFSAIALYALLNMG